MTQLIADLNTTTSPSTSPLALPSNLQMPHVFVIPPEEERQDNPPWCCFDADEQPENHGGFPSNPNIHFLDVPYLPKLPEDDAPAPLARFPVHQPRLRVPMSKKLEKKQRPEALRIIETRSTQARRRDAREDSDVVEVVRVKRGREALTDSEENAKVKRTKTLKARASKALQSIKNVGKAPHRTHVKELWTSSESMPGTFKGVQEQIRSQDNQTEHHPPAAPSKKGSLSRASSRSLSQIFQPVKSSRLEPSFTVRTASSATPTEARHVLPAASPPSSPHIEHDNTNLSYNETSNTFTADDVLSKPAPPIPSMKTKKSINTKFSVRELHRLFSFSPPPPDDRPSPPIAATVPSLSARNDSTLSSTLPSDYPDAPMEEGIFADAQFVDVESVDQKVAPRHGQAFHHGDDPSTPRHLRDFSFEMRLDSLHFESLSFDPEDFDVLMEGLSPR